MNLSIEKQRLSVVVLLLLWCGTLLMVRNTLIGNLRAVGLMWNLFLAFVPLLCSWIFQRASLSKRPAVAFIAFVGWLLFLPNAPYILTDLIHLESHPVVPLWCRLALLLSFAGAGTLFGYLSLLNVQGTIEQSFGKVMGWAIAIFALMASGFGIYLGRFLRWNSWDAITHPIELAKSSVWQFFAPAPHPHPIPVTLVFGIGLIIGYMAIRVLASPAQHQRALASSTH